ncbi:MAG: hypothetical protein BWY43_00361 [candidate division WS2 bacterium ADurb.Bin280]|uniref:Methyltransferase type 11 domain-containing protein n=1 Tax=candidate division WS2 bacterium ADurb.Bin280 TaxID=1852829 RepID=A0A1V5SE02_9BACT|nr:MAG: hypothetical protein BWY43_00361 [candidate division WS2 bacterium ADurb.Bin280]
MNKQLEKFIQLKFEKNASALDLGAGDFEDVNFLNRAGWKCEGVDLKTGVNLEKPYFSKSAPFDLVFSNYTLHKISNKEVFIKTAYNNLKKNGWLFIHTFDKSDENSNSDLDEKRVSALLVSRFKNIKVVIIDIFDEEEGHKHWHKVLEVTAQKND